MSTSEDRRRPVAFDPDGLSIHNLAAILRDRLFRRSGDLLGANDVVLGAGLLRAARRLVRSPYEDRMGGPETKDRGAAFATQLASSGGALTGGPALAERANRPLLLY